MTTTRITKDILFFAPTTGIFHDGNINQIELKVLNQSKIVLNNSVSNPDAVVIGNKSLRIPTGPSIDRTPAPLLGDIRINSDLNSLEYFNGTIWKGLGVLIQTDDIADGAITTPKILDDAVTSAKIPNNAIITSKLAPNSVESTRLAPASLLPFHFTPLSVAGSSLQNNSVTTPKIADFNVTVNKLSYGTPLRYIGTDAVGQPGWREILFDDGDINNPSVAFGNNLTTGFYKPINNEMAMTVLGSEVFRGTATGLVVNKDILPTSGLDLGTALVPFADGYINNLYTNSLLLADGTAPAPSLTFINDVDTGIYRPTANEIGFSTNGIERFRIETIKNVSNQSFQFAAYTTISTPGAAVVGPGNVVWDSMVNLLKYSDGTVWRSINNQSQGQI